MANINKYQAVKSMTGMPSKGSILASGGDNVPAMITDQSGNPQAPAAIKEGEIIFSVPAVVGAGQGDFDKGAELLLELHEQLKAIGEGILQEQAGTQGIGAIGLN
jgi:hypothetical protein